MDCKFGLEWLDTVGIGDVVAYGVELPTVDLPGANRGPRGHSAALSLTAEALGTYFMQFLLFALCNRVRSTNETQGTTRLDTIFRLDSTLNKSIKA